MTKILHPHDHLVGPGRQDDDEPGLRHGRPGDRIGRRHPARRRLPSHTTDQGRLAARTAGSGAAAATTTYAYGADGDATITGPDGVVEHATADSLGRVVERYLRRRGDDPVRGMTPWGGSCALPPPASRRRR